MLFNSALLATFALGLVSAQNATTNGTAYATGLLATLTAANLTTLLSVATANAAVLVPLLQSGGNKTVFAPTNAAFAALPASVLADNAAVLNLVSYHLVNGAFPPSALNASQTVAVTALATGPNANIGGAGQNIVLTGSNGTATVVGATTNASVTSIAAANYQNLNIYIIDKLLSLPQNTTVTATAANLTSLVGAITMFAPTAVPVLNGAAGITVFAPNNAAFAAAAGVISTINNTQIANVLLNHVVPGRVLTSNRLATAGNVTTASGQILSFMTNSTGTYVISGSIMAPILRTNVITNNGVVHVIGQILANTMNNATAAAAAPTSAGNGTAATATGTTGAAATSAVRSSASSLQAGSAVAFVAAAFALLL